MARPCYLKEICVFVDAVVGLQGHASAIGSGCLLCYARNAPPRVLVLYSEAKRCSLWRRRPGALYSSLVSSTSARPAGADCWLLPARRAASAREPDSLVLCARDLSGACSRWCFLASLSLPPSSSGRVGLSSTTSKHTAACPVCRALRRPVAAHGSSVREVLYLPTFCG